MSDVTALLNRIHSGDDPQAVQELLELVYHELHAKAQGEMNQQNAGHTLQATILVNDVCLKLFPGGRSEGFNDSKHFFRSASLIMRRTLVDHARRKNAVKRGKREEMSETKFAELTHPAPDDVILHVHEILEEIAKEDEEGAKVVELRFFVGLTMKEAAQAMGISLRNAERDWTYFAAKFRQKFGGEMHL